MMNPNRSNCVIGSYNCRGFNRSKIDFMHQLLSTVDILFLQEHWLIENQFNVFNDIDKDFSFSAVCGMDNRHILQGRPYGGCAIFWRSNLNGKITTLDSNSRRLCAIKYQTPTLKFLLINVYLPYECNENSDEFVDQLIHIETLILSNLDCYVIIGGDCNVDFSRTTPHTALLDSFCANNCLKIACQHNTSSVDFTYHFSMTRHCVIDHFLVSGVLFDNMMQAVTVDHSVDNLSDHEPIKIKLSFPMECIISKRKSHSSKRVSWAKATSEQLSQYQVQLRNTLSCVCLPHEALLCNKFSCTCTRHTQLLEGYAESIIRACSESAACTIPLVSNKISSTKHTTAGWSEFVKPVREKSLFWHNLWIENNRPRDGVVAECMRRTRAAYHNAVRQVRRNQENIVRQRVAQSLLCNKTRDFWQEIKKIRSSKSTICSHNIDGCCNTTDIANLFTAKYRELYTSVSYNYSEMSHIKNTVERDLKDKLVSQDSIITMGDVKCAISKLKPGKCDYGSNLTTDYFKNADESLFVNLALLFTALFVHGFVPSVFLPSTIVPILKSHKGSVSDSTNYRGIAISSVFSKVIDNIILSKYIDLLSTSDAQFGFKKGHSTNMCTMILKETISHYIHNESSVYCTFLDATKAFDRINYSKLFNVLLNRKLPCFIIRLLLCFYLNNFVSIAWNGALSDAFQATNGVKQGGVLSPVLFCVYIDNLLVELSNSGIGCFIGSSYVGALAYADDIVLLSPTPSGMRRLLSLCDKFAEENDIIFNASKSKCLVVNSIKRPLSSLPNSQTLTNFYINGHKIEFVNNYRHLGHVISDKFNDLDDISDKRLSFVCQANSVVCFFGKLSCITKLRLFSSYCSSFFGCELWDLGDQSVVQICIEWRKAIRRIWNVSHMTHSYLLPLISQCLPPLDLFCSRFLTFLFDCLSHSSHLIRSVAYYGVHFGRMNSPIGRNAMYCLHRYSLDYPSLFTGGNSISVKNNIKMHIAGFCGRQLSESQTDVASHLRELLLLRDDVLEFSSDNDFFLSKECIGDMINYLCLLDVVEQ
jgi:hypothetical protein